MSFIIAAPSSGSGKTTITLGLLRALRQRGVAVRAAKSGPDYIDPQFHAAATGQPCLNLDAWAMPPATIRAMASGLDPLVIEGAMGLFDGAPPDGKGATADLARILDLPVVLVVDAAHMAQSIAPLVAGFVHHDPQVRIAGLILNRVGSPRHLTMLKTALAPLGLPILGAVMRSNDLARPSRHLGLVQAGEMPDLEVFLNTAAGVIAAQTDLDALMRLCVPMGARQQRQTGAAVAPGTRIAVARDAAFSFVYPHDLQRWQAGGAQILPFSPLANEPVPDADWVFLPGGYPELYAPQLARADKFMQSLKNAAQSIDIYGECGGYMVLGEAMTDAQGTRHKMAGLLGLQTSFANRKLHLGYRRLRRLAAPEADDIRAHEFHYATTISAQGKPLFEAFDAEDAPLGQIGLVEGRVSGSFAHIIDSAPNL